MQNSGFADPVFDSQATFRTLLAAMARPGTVQNLPVRFAAPVAIGPAMAALALALIDHETPVWLDAPLARAPGLVEWLRFHTGAPFVDNPSHCAFALVNDAGAAPPLSAFPQGNAEFPDRSAALVLRVETFESGAPLLLAGPGIRGRRRFTAAPLPPDLPARLADNHARFPCGIDLVLVSADQVAALPRSVRLAD